jgi:hypothetical protein
MSHEPEMAKLRHAVDLGNSLNTLLNFNPDFKKLVVEGFLRDAVLASSLNINADKSGTVGFLRGAAVFNDYLKKVRAEAEQARIDLENYRNLPPD